MTMTLCLAALALVRQDVEVTAFNTHESDHYEVLATPFDDTAKTVSAIMERAHTAYEKLVPLKRAEPPPKKLKVLIFDTRDASEKWTRKNHGHQGIRTFNYHHHGLGSERNEIVGYVLPDWALMERLQRVGFNQYLRSFVHEPPQWLGDGLAKYVEGCVIGDDGSFDARPNREMLRRWREGIRKLDGAQNGKIPYVAIKDVVQMSQKDFRASDSTVCESWALCWYLLRGPDESVRQTLTACLKALEADATREVNTKRVYDQVLRKLDWAALEKKMMAFMDKVELPGQAFYREAEKLLADKKYEPAVEKLSQAIEKDPDCPRSRYARGWAHYQLGDAAKAEADLKETLRIDPEHSAAIVMLGKAYGLGKKYDAARKHLNGALREFPDLKTKIEAALVEIDEWEKQRPR